MFSLSYKLSINKVRWKIKTKNISPEHTVILLNSKCDPFNTWKNNSEKVKNGIFQQNFVTKIMEDRGLLIRDLIKYTEHSFIYPLLYGSCQGSCICWSLSDHLRVVLLLSELCISMCCSQQTVKAVVLKQWWQGADKAAFQTAPRLPGAELSSLWTQSPVSAVNPENLLCNFKVSLPFTGRVLLSHLGKHFHRLHLPYWKVCKIFGSEFKRLAGNDLTPRFLLITSAFAESYCTADVILHILQSSYGSLIKKRRIFLTSKQFQFSWRSLFTVSLCRLVLYQIKLMICQLPLLCFSPP